MVARLDKEITQSSQIQRYFDGSTVFITGATGFLGKLILEKLLRTCSDVNKIYILVREKKGKDVEKRFAEVLDNVFFERIKKEYPAFSEKISIITGDCALPDLGLNEDGKNKLINEVNSIFHCAATVRFDEKIQRAVYINIRATRDLLNLAKRMKHLKSFVYVSTAFSNCNRKEIKEEFYEPIISGDKLLTIVNNMSDELLDSITPALLSSWPNTYAFTKAVAEEIVHSYSQDLPVAIVRPSIVIATVDEPVAGWIDNLYGATGVLVGAALGLIRTLHCKVDCRADMVPADFVINCIIAAAWQAGTTSLYSKHNKTGLNTLRAVLPDINQPKVDTNGVETGTILNGVEKVTKLEETPGIETDREPTESPAQIPIYNYVCSTQKPITWRLFMKYAERHLTEIPSPLMVWNYCFFLNPYYFMHVICVFLLHTIPAYTVDFLAKCIGREPILVKGYQKINKFLDVLSYFATREWQFQNHNTQALWRQLNSEDKRLFNFDMSSLDWNSYFHTYARGGRLYLLKDPLDTLPQGRAKYMKLKVAHYTLVAVLLFILYKMLNMLWHAIF